jgi:subtilisin family serine protease
VIRFDALGTGLFEWETMRRIGLLLLLCSGVVSSYEPAAGALPKATAGNDYVEGEVLVTLKPSLDLPRAHAVLQGRGLGFARHFSKLSEWRGRHMGLVKAKNRSTASLIAELEKDPAVEIVEPNYLRHAFGMRTPSDPLFRDLWGLENTGQVVNTLAGTKGADIHFLAAWGLARPSNQEVVVAVIDSGVDYTHPDLKANMWRNPGEIAGNQMDDDVDGYVDDVHGFDFVAGRPDPMDSGEHGSHVSGTIAGTGNNESGVIGVAFQAKIMALRASDDGGASMPTSAIIEAIEYATMMKRRGVNVVAINASFGGSSSTIAERSAIQEAGGAGIVLCAAAGNDGADIDATPVFPASYRLPNMLVVAATDQMDTLAGFSNYGSTSVDLAAPGVNILSTTPPGMTSYVQTASASYNADSMEFAGSTASGGLTGTIYYCGLGYPTNFPAPLQGYIALIQRGTLFFYEKVANAMNAGAAGVIIFNNTNVSFSGTLQSEGNWIPAVTISQPDGLALKGATPVTGVMFNGRSESVRYQYQEGTSMATPHVVGAVAFAAMNFPQETVTQRISRVLDAADVVPALAGRVRTGTRLNLQRVVDAGTNGLPDWWETMYFGRTDVDPNGDDDGDGASNLQEFIAETSPSNAGSTLRLAIGLGLNSARLISWQANTNAIQYLERTPTPWLSNSWVSVFTNVPGVVKVNSYTDPSANTNNSLFYRLRVERW